MEPLMIIGALLTLGVAYVLLPVALSTYGRIRGPRFVICPETDRSTEIELGAVRAALGTAAGRRWLPVKKCGRWPERKACDQRCLERIDTTWAQDHWLLVRDQASGSDDLDIDTELR